MTNWWSLRDEVEAALRACPGFPDDASVDGRLSRLGSGLNHENYVFGVTTGGQAPELEKRTYILRKMGSPWGRDSSSSDSESGGGGARPYIEARLLEELAKCTFSFDIPKFVCLVGAGTAAEGFIAEAVAGVSVENYMDRGERSAGYLATIGKIAAEVHRVDAERFDFLPRHADSRAHVQSELEELPAEFRQQDSDGRAAAEWVEAHLPSGRPAVLLHGDLLPQNIVRDIIPERLGVIDWEFAKVGDPAHDLAIVTRGVRKPLGVAGGMRKLLEAYVQAGGQPIQPADVYNHELLLAMGWLWGAMARKSAGQRGGHPPEVQRQNLLALLRRAEGG